MEDEYNAIVLGKRLQELDRREASDICDILQADDELLFSMYFEDVESELLSKQGYNKITEHLKLCYHCSQGYRNYLDTTPEYFKRVVQIKRARKTIRETLEKIRQRESGQDED